MNPLIAHPSIDTMNYLHEVVDISRGRRPSEIFTTDGSIQWRGVCNNSFIIHLHRISGEKEEGKEMKKERKTKGKKCSSDLAGFELGAVYCEE